jgi:HSP20 family protein
MELPGVNPDDMDISVLGDSLIVKGERRASSEVKDDQYHRCELCYGNFHRQVVLPSEVEAGKIEATYENGMLEVNIPKSKAAKPTRIPIKGQ